MLSGKGRLKFHKRLTPNRARNPISEHSPRGSVCAHCAGFQMRSFQFYVTRQNDENELMRVATAHYPKDQYVASIGEGVVEEVND
jgi:hypothetical protein